MPDEIGAAMVRDLLTLGVRSGGVLLVHSSLRSLGPMPGGAETVVQALLKALGDSGTLLMPALSYASVGPDHPVFDVLATPSCVGALPEYFRTRPGTLRSAHPTHSVCGRGPLAAELLTDHQLDTTPCGPHSPFTRLPHVNGQILFLGCGLRPNTSMHAVEEQVVPTYLFDRMVYYRVVLADGAEIQMRVRSHNFRDHHQRYDRLDGLLKGSDLCRGKVLQADCWLVESRPMWASALAALRLDPFFFVEPKIV